MGRVCMSKRIPLPVSSPASPKFPSMAVCSLSNSYPPPSPRSLQFLFKLLGSGTLQGAFYRIHLCTSSFHLSSLSCLIFSHIVYILVNKPDPIRLPFGSDRKRRPEAGRMILAHWPASGPDPFCPDLIQSARTNSNPAVFA